MNRETWEIKEIPQEQFTEHGDCTKDDGFFFGQSHFTLQEIWIDESLSEEKKKKTLYHELMHCYIKCFIASGDMKFDEESLCDISANSHDYIHEIVEDYFNKKKSRI
jgi:hypothetical protein